MNIYVFTPPYNHKSAGIKMMHYLMYLLQRLGHQVTSNTDTFNSEYDLKPATQMLNKKYDVLIVPEVTELAQYRYLDMPIIRWVLYFAGVLGGPKVYQNNETVFHWDKSYEASAIEASLNGTSELFRLPYLDPKEYNFQEVPRTTILYYVYKGINQLKHPSGALEITHESAPTRPILFDMLHQATDLYSYDRHSALNYEAYLSGVHVKLWNYTWNMWEDMPIPPKEDTQYMRPGQDINIVQEMLDNFQRRRK